MSIKLKIVVFHPSSYLENPCYEMSPCLVNVFGNLGIIGLGNNIESKRFDNISWRSHIHVEEGQTLGSPEGLKEDTSDIKRKRGQANCSGSVR